MQGEVSRERRQTLSVGGDERCSGRMQGPLLEVCPGED
jgi:hypothetical protein